ncbi:hypothetical protein SMSP2_00922 [Limihaloglobus sulfuriphilus]|uniref:Uncharacterized protein n=1 Tax=Limihaloglobus sulfuriphilus TaxID=1851148 RepID=A0A1Q2MD22_9BACT|nr:hypothetical protein [Limihaloglobus sulfuriphilus]AQQ70570.1 hypothetical protein SMSP2_00922 [Limihaloglobus sulfuriphilus]
MKIKLCLFLFFSAALALPVRAQSVPEIDQAEIESIYSSALDVYQSSLGRFIDFRAASILQPVSHLGRIKNSDLSFIEQTCEDVSHKLEKLQAMCNAVNEYEGVDWEEKFANTGLWQAMRGYEVKLRIILCRLDYIRFTAQDISGEELTFHLADLIRRLDSIGKEVDSSDTDAMSLRICRHLSCFQEIYRQEFEERARAVLGKYKSLKNADTAVLIEYLLFKAETGKLLKGVSKTELEPVYSELMHRFESMVFFNKTVFSFAAAIYVEDTLLENFLDGLARGKNPAEFEIILKTASLLAGSESGLLAEMKAGYFLNRYSRSEFPEDVLTENYLENNKSRILRFTAGMFKAQTLPAKGFEMMKSALDIPADGWRETVLARDKGVSLIRRMLYETAIGEKLEISELCLVYPHIRKEGCSSYDDYRYDYEISLLIAQSRDCSGLEFLGKIADDDRHPFSCHARYSSAAFRYDRIDSAGNADYNGAVSTLKNLLLSSQCPPDIRCDAKALYSQMILMKNDRDELEQLAGDLLGENDLSCNDVFPAVAAEVFVRVDKPLAAISLIEKYPANFENETDLVDQAAAEVMGKYEFYASGQDKKDGLFDVLFVLKHFYQSPNPVQRALLSEAVLLMEEPEIAELYKFVLTEQTPVEIVRYMARLNEKAGNYKEAAGLWGRLASYNLVSERKWLYSRAKFYQLNNAAKGRLESAEKLIRACKVLLSDRLFDEFWKSRVETLVQGISNKQ